MIARLGVILLRIYNTFLYSDWLYVLCHGINTGIMYYLFAISFYNTIIQYNNLIDSPLVGLLKPHRCNPIRNSSTSWCMLPWLVSSLKCQSFYRLQTYLQARVSCPGMKLRVRDDWPFRLGLWAGWKEALGQQMTTNYHSSLSIIGVSHKMLASITQVTQNSYYSWILVNLKWTSCSWWVC